MSKYRILVVDDEEDLCEILQFNLENEGYDVDVAYSAEEALLLDLTKYQLLLLDVMMGDISGFKMASMLRKEEKFASLPIIFLTAKDTENDMLTGFNLGADDYISKPYSIKQVAARVKAVLRRVTTTEATTQPTTASTVLSYDKMQLDTKQKKLFVAEEEVSLTKKEFEILKLLMKNFGQVYSREEILSQVWSDEVYVLDRTIDVNITRLRKKLGVYGKNVVTRAGYGYVFED
ncbi:MAG: response regulator transcription factor [Bacteroidales bacterium]